MKRIILVLLISINVFPYFNFDGIHFDSFSSVSAQTPIGGHVYLSDGTDLGATTKWGMNPSSQYYLVLVPVGNGEYKVTTPIIDPDHLPRWDKKGGEGVGGSEAVEVSEPEPLPPPETPVIPSMPTVTTGGDAAISAGQTQSTPIIGGGNNGGGITVVFPNIPTTPTSSIQIQYLSSQLDLNQTQIDWLTNNPAFTNQFYYKYTDMANSYNNSDAFKSATKLLIDAELNSEINGPYNSTAFSHIQADLPPNVLNFANSTVYWNFFNNQQSIVQFNEPSITNDWEKYWHAAINSCEEFSLDGSDNSSSKPRDPAKFDRRVFQPFNFSTQTIPVISDIISENDFVKFDGKQCLDLCEIQIGKANCILTNGYDKGGQTFALRTNPVVPTVLQPNTRSTDVYDEKETLKAISYLVDALSHGIPVIAGVDNRNGLKPNVNTDHVTNHFIVIVGTNVDRLGRTCFHFFDSGTTNQTEGTKEELRLIFVPNKGLVAAWGTDTNPNYDDSYKISQIRRCVKK